MLFLLSILYIMGLLGVVLYFLLVMASVFFGLTMDLTMTNAIFLLSAVGLGTYMAINIWANDVANSVWPAVWSGALKLKWAIVIAALWNILWALIAGWDVVKTVKKGIIDISNFTDPTAFIFVMLSALLAAALWLNVATYLRAPVSTTHSIVGWVMWGWIAAMGFGIVSWPTMWKIAASWVISPVIGWVVAALFLYSIKALVIHRTDKVKYAKKLVPVYVAIMAWAFTTYIIVKGLKHLIKMSFADASMYWILVAVVVFFSVSVFLSKYAKKIENNRKSIAKLFTIPLIFAVALLTFAHGANDVANAIWPIAAIYDSVVNGGISWAVNIPMWILLIWGTGIAVWLAVFGPRIIKTVWGEITELDQIRAFCIALSAAITVIIASQLGLPVSSTHIALGWVFGVWFLREFLHKREHGKKAKLVERSMFKKIISAWLITVPAVAALSGWIFFVLGHFYL